MTNVTPFPERADAAEIRQLASILVDRMQFARQHGITFGGMRDLYEIFGYDRTITPQMYRDRYERGGIAQRVVDAFPKATWRGGFELIEDEDPETTTTFEQAWIDLDRRLSVTSRLQRLDILAGLGQYAILLIGAPGELNTPLPKAEPNQLFHLSAFSQEDAWIQEWETDPSNPRFGLPKFYQLRRLASPSSLKSPNGVASFVTDAFNKPVHWSRIVHVAEGCLDDDVFGQPTLQAVWNLLDDLEKVTGGGAEAFFLRANQGIQIDIDKNMNVKPEALEDLRKQADEYANQIRRILRTQGTKVNVLGSDVANFSSPSDAILTQISGAKSIPKRILTGSEMGELASSQDRDNWKDQVNGRQTSHAGPYIVRPFIDRLVQFGYLPAPKKAPDAYTVRWAHIEVMTETEKANGAAQWAAVNSTNKSVVFTSAQIRDKWYSLPPLTDAEIKTEKERAQPLADPNKPQLPAAPAVSDKPSKLGDIPPRDRLNDQLPAPRARAAEDAQEWKTAIGPLLALVDSASVASEPDFEDQYKPVIELLESAIEQNDIVAINKILGIKTPEPVTVQPRTVKNVVRNARGLIDRIEETSELVAQRSVKNVIRNTKGLIERIEELDITTAEGQPKRRVRNVIRNNQGLIERIEEYGAED
jgi:hypothetical protein